MKLQKENACFKQMIDINAIFLLDNGKSRGQTFWMIFTTSAPADHGFKGASSSGNFFRSRSSKISDFFSKFYANQQRELPKTILTSGLPDSIHNNHPIRYSVHLSLNISETAHYLLLKFCMKLRVNKVKKSNTARL